MTERLYYADSSIAEFSATVVRCEQNKGRYEIVLDKTAFFPEGGGQSGDSGTLDGVRVFDTHEKGGEVIHYCDAQIAVGKSVLGKLDFDLRFRRMQNHSGEHIVSGIVNKMFGYDNVGFHMGSEDITVDYNGYLDREQINEVERRANAAVFANLEIKTEFPDSGALETMSYRSKLELTENVRIVTIDGIDICACCAPHVKRTGEIGIIKLLDAIHYKGGVRIHLLCGYDALEDYGARYEAIRKMANAMCVKQNEVAEAFTKKTEEFSDLRYKYSRLKADVTDAKIARLSPCEGNILVFEDEADGDTMRRIADAGADVCSGICAVFGKSGAGYSYVCVSRHEDLRALSKEINAAISGRGGGSSQMIRGSCTAMREEIEKYFR